MVEKKSTVNEGAPVKKERFEFVLTINDNIVCQRYFYILNFKSESLNSLEMKDCIDNCVDLIEYELKDKTNVFNKYSAPQVYQNENEFMNAVENGKIRHLDVPNFVVLRDTQSVCVWDGEKLIPYGNRFNINDYVECDPAPCVLKLAFYDNGRDLNMHKEIISKVFDGSVYPRFIRNNIDLSNSKNKYENGDIYLPFETAMVNLLIKNRADLIPQIVREFYTTCSAEDKASYTTSDTYGNTKYDFNVERINRRYIKNTEYKYRKKTEAYFGNSHR